VAPHRHDRDVIVGAMADDHLKLLVAQATDGHVAEFGGHGGEPGDSLVDRSAAVLDQPVGVGEKRAPRL
jgi:hypothetical protein